MGRIVIWIVGLALLSIIYVAVIVFQVDKIENDLKDRSNIALVKHKLSWAAVSINGRDAILDGTAPDNDSIQRAEKAIKSVKGIRKVMCRCPVARQNTPSIENSQRLDDRKVTTEITTTPATLTSKRKDKSVPEKRQNSPTNQCQNDINKLLLEEKIVFTSGSSKISNKSFALIEKLVIVAKDCSNSHIEIAGHTDNVGGSDKNISLSIDRAQAVLEYFLRANISANRLKAIGYGSSLPVDGNKTIEGRSRNRRIEFHITP